MGEFVGEAFVPDRIEGFLDIEEASGGGDVVV